MGKQDSGINFILDAMVKLEDLTDDEFDKLLKISGIDNCPELSQDELDELNTYIA